MSPSTDVKSLRICIIGAGMGGLTCALALARAGFDNITVYEMASNLGFVGAGIQMAPNMARILDRLGVWDDIFAEAVVLNETSIREGATDRELGHVDLKYIRDAYGYPHTVGHRATLAGELYNGCKRESDKIRFVFSTTCEDLRRFDTKPTFTPRPREGEAYEVECDVLLGADGVKSNSRVAMLKALGVSEAATVKDTGQAAYRIMLTREQMSPYPDLLELLDADKVIRWIGEKRHIIAYPVSRKQIYNISTTQPDDNFAAATNATYTTRGSKATMLTVFADFCPLVQKLLSLVPEGEVCEWRLRFTRRLAAWTLGAVALVGDACHPTLPHLSQGAAMAIEDGSVLADALSLTRDTTPDGLARCLVVYERARKDWCARLVEMAFVSGKALHLGDGKAREERDRLFREHAARKGSAVPDKWASPDVQQLIYSNDCVAVLRSQFDDLYAAADSPATPDAATGNDDGSAGASASASRKRPADSAATTPATTTTATDDDGDHPGAADSELQEPSRQQEEMQADARPSSKRRNTGTLPETTGAVEGS